MARNRSGMQHAMPTKAQQAAYEKDLENHRNKTGPYAPRKTEGEDLGDYLNRRERPNWPKITGSNHTLQMHSHDTGSEMLDGVHGPKAGK